MILSIIYEICATIFSAKNFKISNDRTGLTRSAVFLIFFIVVHAVGNSVVFGRVAGATGAKYVLGDRVKSLAELSGGGLSGNGEVSKLAGGSYEHTMNAASAAPAKKQEKASSGYTMEEVAKHTKKGDVWVVLHGRVLNVSNFFSQHPGSELAILTFAGKDATAEFDMIHPPDVVEKYVPDAEVVFWLLLTSPLWLNQGLCTTLGYVAFTECESLRGDRRHQPHPSTTLRSRSPCASWAPPFIGGLCGDFSRTAPP